MGISRNPAHTLRPRFTRMISDLGFTRLSSPGTRCLPYETARAFVRSFRRLFTSPRDARQRFCASVAEHGLSEASFTLRIFPDRFGTLRPGIANTCIRAAGDAAFEFGYTCKSLWRDRLLEEAPMLVEANAALASAHVITIVAEHSRATELEVLLLKEHRQQVLETAKTFCFDVNGVYDDRRRAMREIGRFYRGRGKEVTVAALRSSPELFGTFRKHRVEVHFAGFERPRFRFHTDSASRAHSRSLPESFLRAAEAYESRPTIAQLHAAEQKALAAKCALEQVTAAAGRFPWSVEEYIGEAALGLLRFSERHEPPATWKTLARQLAPLLPPAAFSLARQSAERRRLHPA